MAMGLYYYGLRDTNATYATNFLNLVPILTFAISVTVGTEKLRLKTKAGRVKIVGGFFCVVGALVVSLYKGPGFYIDHINWSRKVGLVPSNTNWLRGTLFLMGSCLSYAIWFIIQACVCYLTNIQSFSF
uniref:WAT1-related protein n=1 Tax=Kalanchoe fedtschenkoi TaxID=63787 RepID=A0A7N0VKZ7_KALFE